MGPDPVTGAPIGAAERALDGEDHFGTIGQGEDSATAPGAEVGFGTREKLPGNAHGE